MLLAETGSAQAQQIPGSQPPRMNLPGDIHYSAWRKLCLNLSDGTTVCRTTSSGTELSGELVLRLDLVERRDGVARLQLFVPQGGYLPAGVTVIIDQGAPTVFPYNWCLANACIAAGPASPKLIAEIESGHTLKIEQTNADASISGTSVPLSQFAGAHKGSPAATYDFDLNDLED
jgi:invasion protein IalB